MPDLNGERQGFIEGGRGVFALAFSIAVVTVIVYLSSLQNEFVNWDDDIYVADNLHIRSLGPGFLKWAFSTFTLANWHPVTWVSYALDYALWGLSPAGYHLTSIILHGLDTFLVVMLIVRLLEIGRVMHKGGTGDFISGKGIMTSAAITGLLFGLHPIHVESVSWISERKDVLYSFFFLLSLLSYIRYAIKKVSPERGDRLSGSGRVYDGDYLRSLCLFILSLLSKPMAVTLPVVLLLLDWYPLRRFGGAKSLKTLLMEMIPFFALSMISAVMTFMTQHSDGAVVSLAAVPLSARLLVGIRSLTLYLGKMLWPAGLIPLYPYPHRVSVLSLEFLIPLLFAVAAVVICMTVLRKNRLYPAILGYYVVTLLPVLGVIQVGSQEMADRYTYLPSIGPFLLAGLCLAKSLEISDASRSWKAVVKPVSLFLTIVLLLTMAYMTFKQTQIWRSGITLWSREIEFEPGFSPAYNSRGGAYFVHGLYEEALRDYTEAIRFDTLRDYGYYRNRAIVYTKLKRYDEALRDYTKAILMSPDSHSLYFERAGMSMILRQYGDAVKDYMDAIRLNPRPDFSYYNNRAIAYAKLGLYEEALRDYNEAIRLNQNSSDLYRNRGITYGKLGLREEAEGDFMKAAGLGGIKQ